MSLRPQLTEQIPDETVRIARAAFPKGTLCIRLRDELGPIFQDAMFASLYSQTGQPALSLWRLALVSVLQFVEGLSDRQAADAVRSRIDWKYALALELGDPGFDFSALCEFRTRLVADKGEALLFEAVLRRLIESGLLKPHGRYRTDSTHVLAAIRNLNRLEAAGETLRAALNELATMAPEWLRRIVDEGWAERYGRRVEDYRLPKSEAARRTLAEQIGADGSRILAAVYEPDAPGWLRDLPLVQRLRLYWVQQFHMKDDKVTWRSAADLPPAGVRPHTPYDPDARYGGKRLTSWHGYKVHLTETCDDDAPRLVVHVATTSATVPDLAMTIPIHEALEDRGILPHRHYLDAGYVDAGIRVHLQRAFQVEPISPVRPNCNWQDKAEGGYRTPLLSIGKTSGPAALKATSAPHGGPTGPCRVAISSRSPSAIRLVDNVPAEAPAPALPRHPGVSACVRVWSTKPFSKLAECREWPAGKLTMIDVPASKEPSRRGSEPSVCENVVTSDWPRHPCRKSLPPLP